MCLHDDVIKWKHFPRYWPFVRGIHRSLVNSLRKGQWRGSLMFSLICAWINRWVHNREADDLRRHRAHYDVIAMVSERCLIVFMSARSDPCFIIVGTMLYPLLSYIDEPRVDGITLRWRHNECHSVSDHQPHDCLLNRLSGRRSK